MADKAINWLGSDWVTASDRKKDLQIREDSLRWWRNPQERPWLVTSVHMQTWANEPYRATRQPLKWFQKVDGSVPKVWWLRHLPQSSSPSKENLSMELPFLTRHYFQSHLFLTLEACIYDFVRDYRDESTGIPSGFQDRKRDSVEMESWAEHLTYLGLPEGCSSVVRWKIHDAIKLLRHKTIHREILEDDELWFSMKLPELLGDWHRTFEIQQVFMFVRDSSAMETEARKEMDQLLFGPKTPPRTLLEAHTWLQYSLEKLCFRFTQQNYPEMLEDRKWEWPEQSELQRSWESALSRIPASKDSLDPEEVPEGVPGVYTGEDSDEDPEDCLDDESKFFSHNRLRDDVLLQGRNLRDATSHRDGLSEMFLRKHTLNGILLAIMFRDREQAIDIEATIEAFLTGKTKYQVLTRLRAACAYDRPIPIDQLGERRKREALAMYLETRKSASAKRVTGLIHGAQVRTRPTHLPKITQFWLSQTLVWLNTEILVPLITIVAGPSWRRPCGAMRSRSS